MIKNVDIINNIVVSGMRPTGNIHLGNYNAVIKNWIYLQKKYKCFFFVADIHALTTNFNNIVTLKKNTKQMIVEWLSSGLNSHNCSLFIQSFIPETFELNIFLSMLTNLSRLERIPSYKNEKKKKNSYGFLGYPVLQAADVLILNANYIPVGEDQLAHIEFIKELVKKINGDFNSKLFNEPKALLYKYTKILGYDGKKMSKSQNNTILITDEKNILRNKINKYITDPNRMYRHQPGDPSKCNIWYLHKIYTGKLEQKFIDFNCRNAKIGCVECKDKLFNNIEFKNIKIIKKVKLYEKKEKYINSVIENGIHEARNIAKKTLHSFKTALNLL